MEKTTKSSARVVRRLNVVVAGSGLPVSELERRAALNAGVLTRALDGDLSALMIKDVEALAASLGMHPGELLAPIDVR